jgi:hypothetical protein
MLTPHVTIPSQRGPFTKFILSVRHENRALPLSDHAIAGLEDVCTVERKDLSDLVHSCTADRAAFLKRLRLMARYPHRLLVITSTLSQIKSPYAHAGFDPSRTTQFLIAVPAGAAGSIRLP